MESIVLLVAGLAIVMSLLPIFIAVYELRRANQLIKRVEHVLCTLRKEASRLKSGICEDTYPDDAAYDAGKASGIDLAIDEIKACVEHRHGSTEVGV